MKVNTQNTTANLLEALYPRATAADLVLLFCRSNQFDLLLNELLWGVGTEEHQRLQGLAFATFAEKPTRTLGDEEGARDEGEGYDKL
jgi:hypothetical protein